MDPYTCLEDIRRLSMQLLSWESYYGEDDEAKVNDAFELAEKVQALDLWMSRGGFSPWQPKECS